MVRRAARRAEGEGLEALSRRGAGTGSSLRLLVVGAIGLGLGLLAGVAGDERDARTGTAPTSSSSSSSTAAPVSTTTTEPEPVFVEVPALQLDEEAAAARATALVEAGLVVPTDCPARFDDAGHLPNAPREYRTGVHQGVDFFCPERGRPVVAALPGRVVVARTGWQEPDPADRRALLDTTVALGRTPTWLLAMLWGRHVVVDHGVVEGVGHVTTVAAHLDDIDPAVRPGARVEAGQRLGGMGLSGTEAGAEGRDDPAEVHLHWELLVDDRYLGEGLSTEATRRVYTTLLGR